MNKRIAITSIWPISQKNIGGTERFVIDLAEGLVNAGNAVDVYVLGGESFSKNGVQYMSILGNRLINEYSLQELFPFVDSQTLNSFKVKVENLIDFEKYQIIHHNSLLFTDIGKSENNVCIHTIHTNPEEFELQFDSQSFKNIVSYLNTISMNVLYTAPSEYYTEIYKKLLSNCICVPHGYSEFIKIIDSNVIKSKYSIPNDNKVILFPSRLEFNQKQQDKALRCLLDIKSHLINFTIVFTGIDSQYSKNISRLQEINNNILDVRFISFDDMSEAYSLADFVVLASISESFGYSAIEALFAKKVTFLTEIPTYCEIKNGNNNAILFNPDFSNFNENILANLARGPTVVDNTWYEKYKISRMIEKYTNLYGKP